MPRSTQGSTLIYDQETALGTPGGAPLNMRHNDDLTHDTTSVDVVPNANKGHGHFANTDDMPVIFEAFKESALSIPVGIRRAPTTGIPPLVRLLQAAGCALDDWERTTVAGYVSVTSWERTASVLGLSHGIAQIVELNDGLHYPVLLNEHTLGGVCTPQMALPSASANGNAILRTFTVTPRGAAVGTNKTLFFRRTTRAEHTAHPDMAWEYFGCGCQPGDLEIAHGAVPAWTFDVHAARRRQTSVALAAETFGDTQVVCAIDANCDHGIANYSATGEIAHAHANLNSATFKPGITVTPITGYGGDSLGGVEGWMVSYEPARLETVVVFTRERWTEFEAMPQAAHRYLHIVNPRKSANDPIWGLWMPRAKIIDAPTADVSGAYVTAQINWEASRNVIDGGEVTNEATEAAPWIFAINGTSP